jgi:predicted secreted protein
MTLQKSFTGYAAGALFALAILHAPHASAQTVVPPAGVLNLDANASIDVPQDVVHITLAYEQQSDDPSSLADALNQRTEQALATARHQSNVTAQTGALSIYPSTDRDGHISGWRGRSEVRLDSHDFAAASKLAGALSAQMQVSNVTFSLSPEARDAAQKKLSGEAIAAFRQKAANASAAFGFGGYTIREVSLSGGESSPPRPMMMARMAASSTAKVADVPIEAGDSTVTVNVNGSVQMTR